MADQGPSLRTHRLAAAALAGLAALATPLATVASPERAGAQPDVTPPTFPAPYLETPAIEVPTGLAVRLRWSAGVDDSAGAAGSGVAGYLVHRDGTYLGWVPAPALTFVDTAPPIDAGTAHYEVRAQDAAGNNSAPVGRTTSLWIDRPDPPFPEDVVDRAGGVSITVLLPWEPPAGRGTLSLLVHRNDELLTWLPAAPGGRITITDTPPPGRHAYDLRAERTPGEWSLPQRIVVLAADATPPDAPAVATLDAAPGAGDGGCTRLRWTPAVDDGAVRGYLIHVDGTAAAWVGTPPAAPRPEVLSHDLCGLAASPGRIEVRAQDASGNTSTPTVAGPIP
jgi:hypothetical protein